MKVMVYQGDNKVFSQPKNIPDRCVTFHQPVNLYDMIQQHISYLSPS